MLDFGDEPERWRSLQRLLPDHDDLAEWMAMHGYPPAATPHGERIQAYKHRLTRRYLHIGESGRHYQYDERSGELVGLPEGAATALRVLIAVYSGVEACGGRFPRAIRLLGPEDDRNVLPEFVVRTFNRGCEVCVEDAELGATVP